MMYNEEQNTREPKDDNAENNSDQTREMIDKELYERMVTEYTEKIAALQDTCARLFADVENMKRREAEEQKMASQRIEKKIFLDILPIIDNFERAMLANSSVHSEKQSGFDLIYSLFQKFLKQHNIREIEISGSFDPELHEAISQVTDTQKESGTIVQVFEKGYYLKNKILRHAKVSVVV